MISVLYPVSYLVSGQRTRVKLIIQRELSVGIALSQLLCPVSCIICPRSLLWFRCSLWRRISTPLEFRFWHYHISTSGRVDLWCLVCTCVQLSAGEGYSCSNFKTQSTRHSTRGATFGFLLENCNYSICNSHRCRHNDVLQNSLWY